MSVFMVQTFSFTCSCARYQFQEVSELKWWLFILTSLYEKQKGDPNKEMPEYKCIWHWNLCNAVPHSLVLRLGTLREKYSPSFCAVMRNVASGAGRWNIRDGAACETRDKLNVAKGPVFFLVLFHHILLDSAFQCYLIGFDIKASVALDWGYGHTFITG